MRTTAKIMTAITSAAMIFSLSGCMLSYNAEVYDHADNYSAGDFETESKVTDLDIDWSAGSVNVSYHDAPVVSVTETCNAELKESQQVHTWLDGSTLHVRYCKSGENFELNNAEKKLEVKLPKDTELSELNYDGSSAGAFFDKINAEKVSADTSSGAVQFENCTAKTFDLDASSGSIILKQTGESDEISADSSSGSITVKADAVKKLSADSSSGKINIDAKSAESVSTETSSGDAELRFGSMPSEIEMDASSGDITLYLPKDAGFTAEVDTSSGEFDSEISLSKKGETYVSGSGESKININTSSGDVKIKNA